MTEHPSIGLLPASWRDRHPPQTEAMEEEPLLSVIVLSTLTVYGNSSCTSKGYSNLPAVTSLPFPSTGGFS